MKAPPPRLLRALDSADPAVRLYLFHGPDDAAARSLAARLAAPLGADAERVDLAAAELKGDPARLADEAAAIALFGGRRWIRVDPAGDEVLAAVTSLLEAPAAGNPVAVIAPGLRKDSRLVKLAAASEAAIVHACYMPEGRELDLLAAELARPAGVDLRPDAAQRLARMCNGDRAILASEIEKLALYLDADPQHPTEASGETLDALGAPLEEGDLSRLTAAVFAGDLATADAELAKLEDEGIEGIPLLRALGRRALLLTQLRAQIAEGDTLDRVMATAGKAIFFREQRVVEAALRHWSPDALATTVGRLGAAERAVKASGFVGSAAVREEVLTIARRAARRR